VFATMRRKHRGAKMKSELGQSVDHLRRAATIAAHETSATVGPKLTAARDRVQPTATKAKDAASNGGERADATLTPLIAAATEPARHAGKTTAKASRRTLKANKKNAKKLEKRTNKLLGRRQKRRTGAKLGGLLLAGAAVGAAGAYVMRKRRREQWDEYEPSAPIGGSAGVDDAAFEPAGRSGPTGVVTPAEETGKLVVDEGVDQTSSAQHSPTVARMAGGQGSKD
jgi:hypothetical protein